MAQDLFAAAAAWFLSDPQLTAAFPGGVVASRGAPAQHFPYAKVEWRKPRPDLSLDDEPWTIRLSAYALDADGAAAAGEAFTARFLDETRAPLAWTDARGRSWREAARLEQEAEGPDLVDMIAATKADAADEDADEGYVYRWRQPFDVLAVRTG